MYTAKDFSSLLGTPGFSETLLKNHFGLYEGYVKNTNALEEKLSVMAKEEAFGTPEYNEIKRRFGWEWNGMKLHELYFANMKKGGAALDPNSPLGQKIVAGWGSLDGWAKDFKATGALRG
ncbi:MAG: Superoxide dismutase, partial [Parcubacteria group bacterium GW2011_GWA2_47_7]